MLEKDGETGRVTVGPREALATSRVPLEGVRLHRRPDAVDRVRLRDRATPIPCRVVDERGGFDLDLEQPATAVAPGQLACLMRGDCVVGEGTIG